MENKRMDCNQIVRNSGIILLFFIVNTILITTVLFFVNIGVTIFHAPIAFLLAILEVMILYKNRTNIKQNIISTIIATLVVIITGTIASNIYDISCDGNTYHKLAIGSLKNGWNPVYEKIEDYGIEQGNKIDVVIKLNNYTWANHYAKAPWLFAANIYKLTNNIESGTMINILMLYICFSIIITYLRNKIDIIWAIIVSILIVINPLTITQLFTYYIDGLLSLGISIILYCLIVMTKLKFNKEDKFLVKEHWVILASTLIFTINIKFTGLVYTGFFCFIFYVYWLYIEYKNSNLKTEIIKSTRNFAMIVIVAVLVVGYSTYVKNIINKGHPFYPLFGKEKRDIITSNQPKNFNKIGNIQKFIISMFSECANIPMMHGIKETKLKIPFTVQDKELRTFINPDTRISRIWTII